MKIQLLCGKVNKRTLQGQLLTNDLLLFHKGKRDSAKAKVFKGKYEVIWNFQRGVCKHVREQGLEEGVEGGRS